MIGKVASAGRDFEGIVRYLMRGKRGARLNPARVAWAETRNLMVDEPRLAARLMRATAARSLRCRAPAYHFLVSWHRDDRPSDDLMRQVADVTCEDLGLGEHQRLLVAHDDTAHRHLHIVINRVHAETGTAWNRRQDYRRIEDSLRRQSEALGLAVVAGRSRGRPLVSEMDVLMGLHRFGLASRDDVAKLRAETKRKREQRQVQLWHERAFGR